MTLVLTAALAVLCLQCVVVGGACEKEADLNFDSCDLKHLNDDVLTVSRLCHGEPSAFSTCISSEANHHFILLQEL